MEQNGFRFFRKFDYFGLYIEYVVQICHDNRLYRQHFSQWKSIIIDFTNEPSLRVRKTILFNL